LRLSESVPRKSGICDGIRFMHSRSNLGRGHAFTWIIALRLAVTHLIPESHWERFYSLKNAKGQASPETWPSLLVPEPPPDGPDLSPDSPH
jgi:hypothetical protein